MTVAVAALANPSSTPPSVTITLTGSGSAALSRYVNGSLQGTVRTADGQPTTVNGSTSLTDYEAPYGAQVSYQVNGTGVLTDPVTVASLKSWLVHPFSPALSVPLVFRPGSLTEESFAVTMGTFQPLGRRRPITVTDGIRHSAQSSITVLTQSSAERVALLALLRDTSVLLLNIPYDRDYGFDASFVAIDTVKVARVIDRLFGGDRDFTLPFQVVDPPVSGVGTVWNPGNGAPGTGTGGGGGQAGGGGATGTRTWADAEAQVSGTWADAAARWPTWAAAEVG